MASCISWSNDFSPSATDWVFYKYLGLTVRNLSLRRTSLTCDSGSTVVCLLIASSRCYKKVRGFSSGHCCKAKLLFYIDTWHSGEQVSEPFWASVSSIEEWGIWSRLNYFLPLWDGWNDINTTYLSSFFFFFYLAMLGNWTQGFAHAGQTFSHWATSLSPNIFFLFPLAVLGLELRTLCLQSGIYCLGHIASPFWCGSVKGTACAPVARLIYFLISRCH
jgi:hypothetical protein